MVLKQQKIASEGWQINMEKKKNSEKFIDKYDKVILLCGGNYNKKKLIDIIASLEKDKDIRKVIKFRQQFLFRYPLYLFLGIISSILLLYSVFDNLNNMVIIFSFKSVKPFSVFVVVITMFNFLYYFNTPITSYFNEIKEELGAKGDYKRTSLKEFKKSLRTDYPKNPIACWNAVEGNISDSQIILYLKNRLGNKKTNMIYSGVPYYNELFVDSVYFRIIGNRKKDIKKIKKIIKKNNNIHIIKYHTKSFFKSNIEKLNLRLNHSTYVYGISYLSRFFELLFESQKQENDNEKINIYLPKGENEEDILKKELLNF